MGDFERGDVVRFNAWMTSDQALAFAQFLKRASIDDYESLATSSAQASDMLEAGEAVRKALRQAGYFPR